MTTETILIVDDDPSAQKILQLFLSGKGFSVETTGSARHALELLHAKPYDLVISDMIMDNIDGLNLLKEVNTSFPDIPFMLITAYASLDSAIEALGSGASDYLQKPLNHEELLLKIEKALKISKLRRERKTVEREKDALLEKLEAWNKDLEKMVEKRTRDLQMANERLTREIEERKRAQEKFRRYHDKLRVMASKLSLAEEQERRRLAVEVHDRISQNLAFSKIKLGALKASMANSESTAIMEEVLGLIDEAVQDTRSITSELGSPVLYELGLAPAVQWLTQQTRQRHGISLTFKDESQSASVTEDIRVLLFQAVRELLANVVKHSGASTGRVSVTKDDHHIRIEVEDDGVGFDTAQLGSRVDKTGGFGLFSIMERLDPLGGDIKIVSEPGRGTRVTLRAPLT